MQKILDLAQNEARIYDKIPDILTPEEAGKWLRICRSEVMKRIYSGEIPKECYQKSGNRYKLIKQKLAVLWGIKEAS
jgi:hypothetical protein